MKKPKFNHQKIYEKLWGSVTRKNTYKMILIKKIQRLADKWEVSDSHLQWFYFTILWHKVYKNIYLKYMTLLMARLELA